MPRNVGGDIIEITYNNPNVGSGVFFAVSNKDAELDLGGFRTNESKEGITGNGQLIRTIMNGRGKFTCDIAVDMNSRQDMENIAALAADLDETSWTISWINGITYGGSGFPVGQYQQNTKEATVKLTVEVANFAQVG
jgi:hypothetical protein